MDAAGQLPAGMVTVLLVGIAGPGRPDESGPEAMTAAMARLEVMLTETVAGYEGVLARQRDGNLLVAAFPAASEAVACALELQRAPVAAAGLRVCVYTGPAERDEDGFLGSAVNRAAPAGAGSRRSGAGVGCGRRRCRRRAGGWRVAG